jgi:hypothetical protein
MLPMFFYKDLYDPITCTMCLLLEFNLSYFLSNLSFPIKQHKMTHGFFQEVFDIVKMVIVQKNI